MSGITTFGQIMSAARR